MTSPSFETTTFSPNRTLQVSSGYLDPSTLAFVGFQPVRGGLTLNVDITSDMPTVGTVASPLVYSGGVGTVQTQFDPLTAGTTILSVVQPPGFSTPNAFSEITATVRAPDLFVVGGGSVGLDLQRTVSVTLEAAPPEPVDVTVVVNSGAIASISRDPAVEGGTSITFTGVTTTVAGSFLIQGRSLGSTTLTVQASGYDDGTSGVNVTPSGFRLVGTTTSDFTTTAGAANRAVQVAPVRLDPTTLQYLESQPVRGGMTVNVDVTSSDPSVGVITTSPLVFTSGSAVLATAFDPLAPGTTDLTVEVPSGFSPPGNFRVITATVDP